MARRPPRTPEEQQKLTERRATEFRNACYQLIHIIWRKQYEVGKGRGRKDNCLKLLWCLDLCDTLGWPYPDWAREARAREREAWKQAGKSGTFEQFIVGDPRGRRSEDDEVRHDVIKMARKLADDWKIREKHVWEFVAAALCEYSKKHQYYDKGWCTSADSVERIYRDLSAPWPKYPKRSPNPLVAKAKNAEEAPSNPGEEYVEYEAAMASRGRRRIPYDIDDMVIYYELVVLIAPREKEFSAR